jgi:hypothetical protein
VHESSVSRGRRFRESWFPATSPGGSPVAPKPSTIILYLLAGGTAGGALRVRSKSATPGAWFRYALDGTTPTRTRGYVYCGAISVQPGIRVKAMAYKSAMMGSEPAEAEGDFSSDDRVLGPRRKPTKKVRFGHIDRGRQVAPRGCRSEWFFCGFRLIGTGVGP